MISTIQNNHDCPVEIYQGSSDPLDVMSYVCTTPFSLLIMDDDFLEPNSAHILKSIKKIAGELPVIFITSNSSIELGREISQLGIQFYALKPIEEDTLYKSMQSIIKMKMRTTH